MKRYRFIKRYSLVLLMVFSLIGGFSPKCYSITLGYRGMVKDGVAGVDGLDGAIAVTVSPDSNHVYAAGFGDDAVSVFSRNATTGELTFVETQQDGVGGVDGLIGPLSVTVSPDGNNVYTAAENSVAMFSRNATTGELTFGEMQQDGVGGVDGIGGAISVAVSPGGSHVYVAGHGDFAIAIFSRNATTGALTFVEKIENIPGVFGIESVSSLTVSPDGSNVYTASAGYFDNAVSVFSRNATTGELTFVEAQWDAVGPDGLVEFCSVTVSPDGKHVYAAGVTDNAVSVFIRNATTGELMFVEAQTNGESGVDGLSGTRSVTVSPDGSHVYAAGFGDVAVAVFIRNATTGELMFVETQINGESGVDGLDGAIAVTVSPDSKHVYAAGFGDDAVAVFEKLYRQADLDAAVDTEQDKWDVNHDNQIGLEEAIHALEVTSGLRP